MQPLAKINFRKYLREYEVAKKKKTSQKLNSDIITSQLHRLSSDDNAQITKCNNLRKLILAKISHLTVNQTSVIFLVNTGKGISKLNESLTVTLSMFISSNASTSRSLTGSGIKKSSSLVIPGR